MTEALAAVGACERVSGAAITYYDGLRAAAEIAIAQRPHSAAPPLVSLSPPPLDDSLREFLDLGLCLWHLGARQGRRLYLLDLMRDPATRTAKSLASRLMVARAMHHSRTTGERLFIVTPTSGNKGTALRAAVARAYRLGLATPETLRIAVVVPAASRHKLRACPDFLPNEIAVNPVIVADVERPAAVKELSVAAIEGVADDLRNAGFRPWYSLDLDNYRVADSLRAFVEAKVLPIAADSAPRCELHAVSSGYGLLGYHLGHQVLAQRTPLDLPVPATHPSFFLVQHPATPDMVQSLTRGAIGPELRPRYEFDGAAWRQAKDLTYPAVVDDPAEVIDPTFYTQNPATAPAVNAIIARHGGGGLVVSRRECIDRYPEIRQLLATWDLGLPADFAQLREWSLVMALTAALIGSERNLLPAEADIIVHGSGSYDDASLPSYGDVVDTASSSDELARVLLSAAVL